MRIARQVPELPVLISFVGPIGFDNVTLIGDPESQQDWHVVAGLDVEVFVSKAMSFASIVRALCLIASAVPKRIVLTFREGPRVECGEMRTVAHEDGDFALFDWFPIAIGPMAYPAGQVVARQLLAAIADGEIPTPFDRAMDLVVAAAAEKQPCA